MPESMATSRSPSQRRRSLSASCRSLRLPSGLSTPCVQSKPRRGDDGGNNRTRTCDPLLVRQVL